MIFDMEAEDLEVGDNVIFTKTIKRIVDHGPSTREIYFEDGTAIVLTLSTTIEVSSHPIKVT